MLLCAGVLSFGELLADSSGHGRWNASLYDTGRFMRLDAAAQRALNVLKQRGDANESASLYGLLNRARTAMAKRLLKVAILSRDHSQNLLRSADHASPPLESKHLYCSPRSATHILW